MNNIKIFENQEFGAIRTMSDEQGEPLFCGKDVARALGYKNPERALRIHVSLEDKGVNEMVTPWWNATIHLHQRVGSHLPLFI